MFWDFMKKIAYIVLKKLPNSGVGRCENQSNNAYFSTSLSNIAVVYILLYFLETFA